MKMRLLLVSTFLALICSAMGDCPATDCEPEGKTMSFEDLAQCNHLYCECVAGVWEEETCNGSAVYNPEVMECDHQVNMSACAATTEEPSTMTDEPTTTGADVITTADPVSAVPDCVGMSCFPGNEAQATPCSNSYCVCGDDGVYVKETCDGDQIYVFDPVQSSCLDPEEVSACSEFGRGYCPEVECGSGGTMEPYDEDDCTDQYCICSLESGKWEEEACAKNTVYATVGEDCVLPEYSDYCTNPDNTCPHDYCSVPGEKVESVYECSPLYCLCQDNGGYHVQNCAPGLVYKPDPGYCANTAPSCEMSEAP